MAQGSVCKECKFQISETFYFCPNCGKKLKEPPYKFSWGKTLVIMVESILLPPFGLIPGIRHVIKNDIRAQIVGAVAIGLTIISTAILIILVRNMVNTTVNTYNQIYELQGLPSQTEGQSDVLKQIESLKNN